MFQFGPGILAAVVRPRSVLVPQLNAIELGTIAVLDDSYVCRHHFNY